jgi:anaerobic ribonucleoside-triphosphate reductase activating protein
MVEIVNKLGTTASVARIVPVTEAEGPGRRFAVWFQGCPLRCPGCCNPEMLPFAGGRVAGIDELCAEMETAIAESVEGISLLGGEPFAQPAAAATLARAAHGRGLTVMVFSGFTIEELRNSADPHVGELLQETDILVDGPYLREQPETHRRWIGSSNQRVHFLSDRCRADDPRWQKPNTLELRWRAGQLTVNGFPAPQAVGLWKNLRIVPPAG